MDDPGLGPSNEVPANMKDVKNVDEVEVLRNHVNDVTSQVSQLEQKVQEVEKFFLNKEKQNTNSKRSSVLRSNKVRQAKNIKRHCEYELAAERMQELIRQFGTILNQITQKKDVRSSLEFEPDKSCQAIDFSRIRKRMESEDASKYKHVREIYADVRSVLKSAMKNDDEKSDAYVTAKTLLAKFEDKWFLLLPKVMHEEKRQEEEAESQQVFHTQIALNLSNELHAIDMHLKQLKERVLRNCRKMSTLEKRELGKALAQLSADDLRKALEIVADSNPAFQASAEEVDLDIDAQDESTLRKLKHFVLDVRQAQIKALTSPGLGGDNDNKASRKREISDAPSKKKSKR